MQTDTKMKAIKNYVYTIFDEDPTGHDFFHMKRVARMARFIAVKEGSDLFICEAAGWVHDVGDKKLFSNRSKALEQLNHFLRSIDCTATDINAIREAVDNISFSRGKIPASIEGKIVQDADRLDAIGAIGVARTFSFGGAKGQLLWHDSEEKRQNTSIQHFYDKLLYLKGLMHTRTAKQIAEQRHRFMEMYLQQFLNEWQ
ncbi:HD domain-containing protein [Lentibacillus persicus]|nr:HD domain-containing protein [Lentibacillus persicus]